MVGSAVVFCLFCVFFDCGLGFDLCCVCVSVLGGLGLAVGRLLIFGLFKCLIVRLVFAAPGLVVGIVFLIVVLLLIFGWLELIWVGGLGCLIVINSVVTCTLMCIETRFGMFVFVVRLHLLDVVCWMV